MKFDGGIFLGRNPKTGTELSEKSLLKWMESSQTASALFCSQRALFDDMVAGNAETIEISRQHRNLIPFGVINPLHFDISTDYLQTLKKAGIKGFLFAPSLQYGTTRQINFKASLLKAGTLGLPIQVIISNNSELADVYETTATLKAPLLIRAIKGGGYSLLTDFIAFAKARKNVFFDVGSIVQNAGISYLAKKIGVSRLYFASNAPFNIHESVHLLIQAAPDLTVKEKAEILSGSLSALFSKKKVLDRSELSDEASRELNRPKIDTHWHSDGWDLLEPAKGLDRIENYLNAFGYRAVCISSITALNYDLIRGNEQTFAQLESDPRLFGYCVVDPLRVPESLKLLEKFSKHSRFVGLKTIQDYYGLELNDSKYYPLFEWAQAHNAPVMAHLPGLGAAARRFPKVTFIAAHMTWDRLHRVLDAEGQIPKNIYFDIATSHAYKAETSLAELIARVGADRVLYSADGPLMSPAWTLGKIIEANLDAATRDKLYLRNALTLFPKIAAAIS